MRRIIILITGLTLLASVLAGTGCESQSVGTDTGMPIFNLDYDDSWVTDVPAEIGGYRVLFIHTPMNRACTPLPVIGLQTPPEIGEGDIGEVVTLTESIPGSVRVSVSPSPTSEADTPDGVKRWNEEAAETGCNTSRWSGGLADLPDDS